MEYFGRLGLGNNGTFHCYVKWLALSILLIVRHSCGEALSNSAFLFDTYLKHAVTVSSNREKLFSCS